MLVVLLAALVVATVPLAGGRLSRLAAVRLRRGWLLGVALGLQVLVISIVPTWPRPLLVAGHLVSYLLAGAFVWLNRRVRGLPVVALGGALNGVTIAANGGTLPASAAALARAGIHPVAGDFTNSGVLAHPHLAWLGDVFAVPAGLPLANVFSIGDVLILVGLAAGVHLICGSRLSRRPVRPAGQAASAADTDLVLPVGRPGAPAVGRLRRPPAARGRGRHRRPPAGLRKSVRAFAGSRP